MTDAKLRKLLDWHQGPAKDMGHIDNKRMNWVGIQSSNKADPLFKYWTEENEKSLGKLDKHGFYFLDTQLGHLEDQRQTKFEGSFPRIPKDSAAEYLSRLTCNTLGGDSRRNA